jgi:hypothetical protein
MAQKRVFAIHNLLNVECVNLKSRVLNGEDDGVDFWFESS